MRVPNLILPTLAALALASAPAASAAAVQGSGGGASTGPASATGSSATPSANSPSASSPSATSPGASASSGGVGIGATPALPFAHPTVPGTTAKIIHGLAYAPADAPQQVQQAIWAGDRIRLKPYRVGGGHGVWNDTAYDCSGTVSYVLHAAHMLRVSEDSGEFMSWGRHGAGAWMTIYTNPGHAFIEIAGIRLDTSAEGDPHPAPGSGPRWRPLLTDTGGYVARHPTGF
ncbi:MAG TPA: hypothetical protein VGF91_01845 [Solirubrobacteraceae bacterium]